MENNNKTIPPGAGQEHDVNALIQRRHEELDELKARGVLPFAYSYDTDAHSAAIKEKYEEYENKNVKIAGRIMAIRRMGKASFAHLQDDQGKIQIYLKKDDIGENYDNFKLLDIGDIIGVEGFVFKTKTGEISVHSKSFTLLSKSIRPIPIPKEITDEKGNKTIFDQFADKELRYRQRYLDLVVNTGVKEVFRTRSRIVTNIRKYLDDHGLVEVETPILQPLYGGASARPFITHHNALDIDLYLRIADELYLKRLIVGGFEGVYEISKDFRNEGMDRTHNPEFTMLELYVAYKDYFWMMSFVENMVANLSNGIFGKVEFEIEGNTVNFNPPWQRISMVDALKEKVGVDVQASSGADLVELLKSRHIEMVGGESKGKLIDLLFEATIQPDLIQPTFVIDYPIELSPLAKRHRTREGLVERFEGFVLGREICNAFTELNDPIDQRNRFEDQSKMRAEGDEEAQQVDEDFIRALEYGMPPTSGLGVGIDRLVMLLTNQSSIRDVILFPQMRPQK